MPDLDLLLAYLHVAAIFLLVGVLSVEWVLLRVGVAGDRLKQLAQADRFYGAIAGVVIITGLLRVFLGYAGAGYYAANWVFWTKMGLFLVTGLLSAPATMAIIKWHSALEADGTFIPKAGEVTTYRRLLHAQIAIVLCIPLLGLAMGHGYGA